MYATSTDRAPSHTVTFDGTRFDIVEFDLDVTPGRTARFAVTDRFLVVEGLDPAPPPGHRDTQLLGRIWPATGSCRAVTESGAVQLTLHLDHGRIFSWHRDTPADNAGPLQPIGDR